MEERRKARRWRSADYSKDQKRCSGKYFGVYNRANNDFIGYLVDLSSEGMMILSKKTLTEGEVMKLRIELPEEIKGSDELMVEARNVWCEKDSNPEFHRLGFSFMTTFPHHAEIVDLLFQGSDSSDSEKEQEEISQTD
jgi:c-di-GMP-binding flagellar brake protein YcgR